jgi:hypothetical protein
MPPLSVRRRAVYLGGSEAGAIERTSVKEQWCRSRARGRPSFRKAMGSDRPGVVDIDVGE